MITPYLPGPRPAPRARLVFFAAILAALCFAALYPWVPAEPAFRWRVSGSVIYGLSAVTALLLARFPVFWSCGEGAR